MLQVQRGGNVGIRTLGTLLGITCLANKPVKPLQHVSNYGSFYYALVSFGSLVVFAKSSLVPFLLSSFLTCHPHKYLAPS